LAQPETVTTGTAPVRDRHFGDGTKEALAGEGDDVGIETGVIIVIIIPIVVLAAIFVVVAVAQSPPTPERERLDLSSTKTFVTYQIVTCAL
jgi:hypothetical protein